MRNPGTDGNLNITHVNADSLSFNNTTKNQELCYNLPPIQKHQVYMYCHFKSPFDNDRDCSLAKGYENVTA